MTGLLVRALRRTAAIATGVALGLAAVGLPIATPVAAADSTVTITGHGYGHGRGLGQYGAYGFAVDHGWMWTDIISRYYGGTTLSSAGDRTIDVELQAMSGKDAAVCAPGLVVNGMAAGTGCVLVKRASAGVFTIYRANNFQGSVDPGWVPWVTVGSGITIASSADQNVLANLPRVWDSTTSSHGYRGSLVVVDVGPTMYLLNRVSSETYLRGVLPREVPASWGSASNGRGMQALMAQAVAARSYALSGSPRTSGALICDTTSCQVYGGAYTWASGAAAPVASENALTDQAIAGSAGQVIMLAGRIARAEFSSSTGGYTAGGTFPAVVDEGDATSANPYHNWTTTTTMSAIGAALGTGTIRTISVTGRNGLGADGGRVTQVTVVNTSGTTSTFSGAQVRSSLGLKSDWFSINVITQAQAQVMVKALYADILGRAPDASGMAAWTNEILRTQSVTSTGMGLSTSTERLEVFVTQQYQAALHRNPEPGGLSNWVRALQVGWTVPDLQAGIYGSDEALSTLGGGNLQAWVAAMYTSILGRTGSASETAGWADYAASHGRVAAVSLISHSEEAARVRLTFYYRLMLGRDPDPSGINTWVPVLMAGRGDILLPVRIGESEEYWARAMTRF